MKGVLGGWYKGYENGVEFLLKLFYIICISVIGYGDWEVGLVKKKGILKFVRL